MMIQNHLPLDVWTDLQRRVRYRVRFVSWRDGEDDHGYYRVSTSEWIWPMTFTTRAAARAVTCEAAADHLGWGGTVEIEEVPEDPAPSRRAIERWIRRARRAA